MENIELRGPPRTALGARIWATLCSLRAALRPGQSPSTVIASMTIGVFGMSRPAAPVAT